MRPSCDLDSHSVSHLSRSHFSRENLTVRPFEFLEKREVNLFIDSIKQKRSDTNDNNNEKCYRNDGEEHYHE